MNIHFNQETGIFSLTTAHTLYQLQADPSGVLLHLYYGPKTDEDMRYLIRLRDRGFSANPYEMRHKRGFSLDTLPQEYAGSGTGDYRISAVQTVAANGSRSADLRYAGYTLRAGREPLKGLPYVREAEDTETLTLTLRDEVTGLEVHLQYHVYPALDVIVRSARLVNAGQETLTLTKAASACLDFLHADLDAVHFHGRHCMERMPQRLRLPNGISAFGSTRGMSSHHHNPFVILCDRRATEDMGACWGCMLMYSGSHLQEMELDQAGTVRLVSGIHPEGFSWQLAPGEAFQTPEALLSFSTEGLNGLSGNYHDLIRQLVIPARWQKAPRPVLINSWEGCYFDFDARKILSFARAAAGVGLEMLVLDDGWFGQRNDDNAGLGDWVVNEGKLGCSLKHLSEEIHALGLQFGLWFEPEMVNEDSDLFRAHPDWALTDPGRRPAMGRNQLVLDMSRQEVVDYLFDAMCSVLDHAKIEYVKWDFNRSIANCFSRALPAGRQGEVAHRFMLGTYQLLSRLLSRYPDLMIEGCSGGGGRFDTGMLFYCPQIWCSDDTDAIERLIIQQGTSYGYPVSAMGAHVSAVPNHQTGRTVPLFTRSVTAQCGTFGYELNPETLSDAEKAAIRRQIADDHAYRPLISHGRYYRLTELDAACDWAAWMFVAPDQGEALVSLVVTHVRANGAFPFLRLRGLKGDARYRVRLLAPPPPDPRLPALKEEDRVLTGAALMEGGYCFPPLLGDFPACQLHLTEV